MKILRCLVPFAPTITEDFLNRVWHSLWLCPISDGRIIDSDREIEEMFSSIRGAAQVKIDVVAFGKSDKLMPRGKAWKEGDDKEGLLLALVFQALAGEEHLGDAERFYGEAEWIDIDSIVPGSAEWPNPDSAEPRTDIQISWTPEE